MAFWTTLGHVPALAATSHSLLARGHFAVRVGPTPLDRVSVTFPPTLLERIGVGYTSASGSVVAVEIDKATGAVTILDAVTALECGRALVPEQVRGQAEGGFAMGVGYARAP